MCRGSSLGSCHSNFNTMMNTFKSSWFLVMVVVVVVALVRAPILVRCQPSEMGKIYDITHRLEPKMPAFDAKNGAGTIVTEAWNQSYYGTIKLNTHLGTHVDSPGHFYEDMYLAGLDVDSLDLHTLNGPVLVVETPRDKNITAEVLRSLNIPTTEKRVIFKTANTYSGLMKITPFTSSYTGLSTDGAEWIVTNNPNIKLVGIDYLSIGMKDEIVAVHKVLLGKKDIIPVEGLKLDEVNPGSYTLHCLPLRIPKADGSPARCILVE